jgi:luciferase family oxidoreductase group 1
VSVARLSVLDQSPVSEDFSGAQALHNTLELARLTDRLGFHRYWVAEHHGGPMLASASPEALIGPIASATTNLRVGSGGVMLPHYSPYKVAETFSILAALYPGRIDLGIGRASGTDPMTTHALQRDRRAHSPDDFPQQLGELLAYLEGRIEPGHPFARLSALPGLPESPTPWMLGSSPQSGIWAAELGLPYAFADFINRDGVDIARRYITDFREAGRGEAPEVAVAAWVICAETDEEAQRLASSSRMTLSMMLRGRLIKVPPPEVALKYLASQGERPDATPPGRRAIIGSPETVREGIERLASDYAANEVIVVTITYDHAARLRSYELVAQAMGLTAGDLNATAIAQD